MTTQLRRLGRLGILALMKKTMVGIGLTLGVLAAAAPAMATPVTFTNAAAFATAAAGANISLTTEDFGTAANQLLPATVAP